MFGTGGRGRTRKEARKQGASRGELGFLAHLLAGPRILLILSTVLLVAIGLVMVFSASSIKSIAENGNAFTLFLNHLKITGLGVLLSALFVRFFDYRWLEGWLGIAACVAVLAMVVATMAVGTAALGAQRWLSIGGFSLQPSEFAKIALVGLAAYFIARYNEGSLTGRRFLLWFLGAVVVPLGFIYKTQSDLGTTMIVVVGLLAIAVAAQIDWKYILGLACAIFAFGIFSIATTGYRSDRLSFLDPWSHMDTTGYQLVHSFYAFARGGLFGTGLGNSHEKFQYLPEAHTDFIFSIVGEEFGLLGTLVVVTLFFAFLYAGLQIARDSHDRFGSYFAVALTVMLVFQAFLNMVCVLGLAPTTGKPLPFLSSGGSSMLSSLLSASLLLSISLHSDDDAAFSQRRGDLRLLRPRTAKAGAERDAAPRSRTRANYDDYAPRDTRNPRNGRDTRDARDAYRIDGEGGRRTGGPSPRSSYTGDLGLVGSPRPGRDRDRDRDRDSRGGSRKGGGPRGERERNARGNDHGRSNRNSRSDRNDRGNRGGRGGSRNDSKGRGGRSR